MKSQPNAKAGMYTLNEDFDMKAEIVAMERRLEELKMWEIQKVHTIFEKPVQAIPCSICLSYEHLVEECPTIQAVREIFGDYNTYNSNCRNHQISLGNHNHVSTHNLLKPLSKPRTWNKQL